jgi:hypothetical protein
MRVSLRLASILDILRNLGDFSNGYAALGSSSLTSLSNSDLSSLCTEDGSAWCVHVVATWIAVIYLPDSGGTPVFVDERLLICTIAHLCLLLGYQPSAHLFYYSNSGSKKPKCRPLLHWAATTMYV